MGVVTQFDWRGSLDDNGKGKVTDNFTNLMIYIRFLPGICDAIRYNEMTTTVEFNGKPLKDEDYADIRMIIESEGQFKPKEPDVVRAVARYALDRSYHPVRDYLNSLKWDGKARLDIWLKRIFGAPDKPLISAMGRKFLVAAAKRIYEPGCKFDYMLVLEGDQGIGKTSGVIALFGEQYVTSDLHEFTGKAAAEAIQGMWCAEIGELAALSRTDVRDSKKFVTNTIDRYRPSYGRNVIHRPRVTVFVGTTNDDQYLLDPTGGRRYWPVPCTKVDMPALLSFRDQMWAEAVHLYQEGESVWLDDDVLIYEANEEQKSRYSGDVWEGPIDAYLSRPDVAMNEFVRVSEIMFGALGIETSRMSKGDEMRVTKHLKNSGWVRKQRWSGELKKPEKVWFPPVKIEDGGYVAR